MKKIINSIVFNNFLWKFDLKMKLTTLFVVVSLFQLKANDSYSQTTKLSLDMNHVMVNDVIRKIESLSEFKFLYNRKDVDLNRFVSIRVKKKRITAILSSIFLDSDTKFEVFNKQIVLKRFKEQLKTELLEEQEREIKGIVKDDKGNPLSGVNILVQGTQTGTQTGFDGDYTISVNIGQTLIFTYIGQKQVIRVVGTQNVINVQMEEDAQALDEVVVTALGIIRSEKSLGYSVAKVKGKDLLGAQNSNTISALSGKVAGVSINSPSGNIGGSQRILIRGANSVTGNNQPLFVVDGIPMDNSSFNTVNAQRGGGGVDYGSMINDINPNTIESVTVLKGSAASLYGSRASNGVILITTKSGNIGNKGSKDGVKVEVNSSLSFTNISVLPNLQRQYGGGSKDTFVKKNIKGTDYNIVGYITDESWGPKFDPSISVLHWDAFDSEFSADYLKPRAWVAPSNDVNSFFETGITYDNNVTVYGGNAKGSSMLTVGNNYTTGTFPTTKVTRNNIGVKFNRSISDKLKVGVGLNYVNIKGRRPETGYSGNSIIQKFFQFGQRQLDFDRLKKYKIPNTTKQRSWNRTSWDKAKPKYSDNPYWTLNENYSEDVRNRFYGNLSLQYDIFKGFNIRGSVYGDTYNFQIEERVAVGSKEQPLYRIKKYNNKEFNYELIANYNKQLGDINLNVLVGGNMRKNGRESLNLSTTGGLASPGVFNLLQSNGPVSVSTKKGDYTAHKHVNSIYGATTIGFKDQVFIDLTARNDQSTTLPTDNNSYFYPSASLSWLFTKIIPKNDVFNFGKLRLGWSQVGNDTKAYRVTDLGVVSSPFKGNSKITVSSVKLNENLKSETTTTAEIGLDLSFLDNKINLEGTYYKNKTVDQIVPVNVSFGTGFGSQYINVGKMTNKGLELMLNVVPVVTKDFKWELTFNFAKNYNKLESLQEGLNSIGLSNAPFRAKIVALVGEKYGTLMGTDFIYDDKGNKLVNSSGYYLPTKRVVSLGSVLPDYTAGLRSSFTYKNFDFGFLIDTSQGGKYFSTTHMWGMYSGMLEETAADNIREKGIVLPGVTGTVTFADDGSYKVTSPISKNTTNINAQKYGVGFYGGKGTPDAQNVFDASYFKLREINLGYTFSLSPSIAINSLKIGIYGRNLLVWGLAYSGIDPETVSTGSGNIQGLEGGLAPATRNYGINLQLTF